LGDFLEVLAVFDVPCGAVGDYLEAFLCGFLDGPLVFG
jgi:hypothetical protein